MPDLLVITGASAIRGTMELYLRQLAEASIEVEVVNISRRYAFDLKGKIEAMRWAGSTFSGYGHLVLSDAFDVTFYGTKEDVLGKMPARGILWAAEKNCYPDMSLIDRVPPVGPWRFGNGGVVSGTPQGFVNWADRAERHPRCMEGITDQQFLNERLADRSPLCEIDSETNLMFCLYGGYDELEFEAGRPVNRKTGTHPNFIHANGNWPAAEMFQKYERSLV